jgi:hypothetical protein
VTLNLVQLQVYQMSSASHVGCVLCSQRSHASQMIYISLSCSLLGLSAHCARCALSYARAAAAVPLLPADVCVIELGGTVGDIESSPFVEALRQFHFK